MQTDRKQTPIEELIEWLDSDDCHIDQYAVEQVKEKTSELLTKEQFFIHKVVKDTWDIVMNHVKEMEDYRYGKRGGYTTFNKEEYLNSLK